MPKKKEANPIEKFVQDTVIQILDKRETKIKVEDAQEIVKAIIPELEIIVSKIVLQHFNAIADFVKTNLKDPKEK